MTDYSNLVEALRCKRDDCEGCDLAFFDKDEGWICQYAAKDDDAADAIEALEAEVDFYKKRLKEWCGVCPDADCSNCEILGHGHWIPQVTDDGGHNDLLDCSLCGESIWNTQKNKKFCPNCGAKMTEVQDG